MELDVVTEWALVIVGLSIGLAIVVGMLGICALIVVAAYRYLFASTARWSR